MDSDVSRFHQCTALVHVRELFVRTYLPSPVLRVHSYFVPESSLNLMSVYRSNSNGENRTKAYVAFKATERDGRWATK